MSQYAGNAQATPAPSREDALNSNISRLYEHLETLENQRDRLRKILTSIEGTPAAAAPAPNSGTVAAVIVRSGGDRPAHLVGSIGYFQMRMSVLLEEIAMLAKRIEDAIG